MENPTKDQWLFLVSLSLPMSRPTSRANESGTSASSWARSMAKMHTLSTMGRNLALQVCQENWTGLGLEPGILQRVFLSLLQLPECIWRQDHSSEARSFAAPQFNFFDSHRGHRGHHGKSKRPRGRSRHQEGH